jgi:hypothetical protein
LPPLIPSAATTTTARATRAVTKRAAMALGLTARQASERRISVAILSEVNPTGFEEF